MRRTLTLDPDVAARAKMAGQRLGKPFKEIINSALRIGLDQILKPVQIKPYKSKPHPLGLRPGFNYDNIGEVLAQAEGEDYR